MNAIIEQPPSTAELQTSRGRRFARRWLREHMTAAVGGGILAAFILIAILAPVLEPYKVSAASGPPYAAPSGAHWLGTNDVGIDMLSLLMQGARPSLLVAACASIVSICIGGTVGIVAGYFGRAVDAILSRIVDLFLVIPVIPLMVVTAAVWGPSLWHIILVIGLLLWTAPARLVRAQVQSLRTRAYVLRARSQGASPFRIIARHILPQVAPMIAANCVLTVALAVFYETALEFLGLGNPATISWGEIIEEAFLRSAVSDGAWWAIVPAGICVAGVVMSAFLVAQDIEAGLNPQLRSRNPLRAAWMFAPPARDWSRR